MKDNNPQTVGDLLNKMGNKGRAGAPGSSNGSSRLGRIIPIVLLFLVFAAAAAYYFRDIIFKTGKQAVRTSTREGQPSKAESLSTNSRATVNSLPAAPTPPLPAAETKATPTPPPAGNTTVQPETRPKGERQPALPKAQPEATPGTTPGATASGGEGNLTVQIGSYATAADAGKRAEQLRAAGVDAYVVRAALPGRRVVYRLQAGHFNSEEDAARYAGQLRANGVARDTFVAPGGRQQ